MTKLRDAVVGKDWVENINHNYMNIEPDVTTVNHIETSSGFTRMLTHNDVRTLMQLHLIQYRFSAVESNILVRYWSEPR